MQRPRRTSEFHEDPNGVKRQSRPQQRSIAPSPATASKFLTRQSRIAVPTRPPSADRAGPAGSQAFQTSIRSGISTPHSVKPTTSRVLFTNEKHRGGNSGAGGPLHNDKKWVQEQTQRITEYLMNQSTIGGLSTDFLQKGLRQMSIKHFVAIVNFFLNHIWGKRFVVGSNHVEDIMQILQKLQYPHPVSKSWLKTPNTQHSFGNVIVLLDYLMEFVPPYSDADVEPQSIEHFELQEPHEQMNGSRISEDLIQIPDLEFQRELLLNTEEGFMLWDTQMEEEFTALQQETCNLLIKKMCNFPDVAAIRAEVEKLNKKLKSLQDFRPKEDKDLQKLHEKLVEEFKFLSEDLLLIKEEHQNINRQQRQLSREKMEVSGEVAAMEQEVATLQDKINRQLCTVEQRNQLMAEHNHLEQLLAVENRTLRDLESRNHNQQIVYARVIKKLTDDVESLNAFMREIAFSDVPEVQKIPTEKLQLPLKPEEQHLQKLIPLLIHIKEATQSTISAKKKQAMAIQQNAQELMDEIDTKLETKLTSLRLQHAQAAQNFDMFCQKLKKQIASLNLKTQQLENQMNTVEKSLEELQQAIEEKRNQIDILREQNEVTMQQAEDRHEKHLEKRRTYLQSYSDMMEQTVQSDILWQLIEKVETQEQQLALLRKEFESPNTEEEGE
ncbi:putative leucine-rich repeat-containing protein DDB_G0290503 [Stomoxys calcitrans]|uniref:putative leucine-rich repeat-containing protein DDB_G0290503 n=1 Tax=Stomoxys calcitrans TaxID=35570 RepID=UPI0027E2E835|nr:putative leucine-rich repeat-containing protein DDB_G0290503 [Stomoxys calcitrans]